VPPRSARERRADTRPHAAAAATSSDNVALYQQLSVPQHSGVTARLRRAVEGGQLLADADLDAIADALIGILLLRVLNGTPPSDQPATEFDGLLDAILNGAMR
jgi:tetracycline repressor-like protein